LETPTSRYKRSSGAIAEEQQKLQEGDTKLCPLQRDTNPKELQRETQTLNPKP
jgi:hypothetical protein